MKQVLLLLLFSALALGINAQSIEGTWKTIDDETGKARSYVRIYKAKSGTYSGKILELLNRGPEEDPDPYCTKCAKSDSRYNKRVTGMIIVLDMKPSNDGKSASGGTILDPKNGKVYGCNMKLEDDNTLKVRGYLGIPALGRTQQWVRVE